MEEACRVCGKQHKTGSCTEVKASTSFPPLDFSDHSDKFLGEELKEALQVVADECSELDILVLEKVATVDELANYLSQIGYFDKYAKDVEYMADLLFANEDKITPLMQKHYGLENAPIKIAKGINSSFTLGNVRRPFFELLWSDVSKLCFVKRQFKALEICKADPKNLENVAKYPLIAERSMLRKVYYLHRNLKPTKYTGNTNRLMLMAGQIEADRLRRSLKQATPEEIIETDEMLETILEQEANPGTYPLSMGENIPYVESVKVTIKPENNASLMWGSFEMKLKNNFSSEPLTIYFDLSVFSKDLCLQHTVSAKLGKIFEYYGVTNEYQALRSEITRAVWSAFETGLIPLKQQEEEHSNEITELEQALEESNTSNIGVEQVSKVEETNVLVSNPEVKLKKGNRTKFSNLSYDRVLTAFKRLGVNVEFGGRHPKLSIQDNGSKRSVPFVNQHSKSIHYMARIIKDALRILGLDEQEFVANLK